MAEVSARTTTASCGIWICLLLTTDGSCSGRPRNNLARSVPSESGR
jgi:hypothetical protein